MKYVFGVMAVVVLMLAYVQTSPILSILIPALFNLTSNLTEAITDMGGIVNLTVASPMSNITVAVGK